MFDDDVYDLPVSMLDVNIHCIVIGYGLPDDMARLFEAADAPNIHWHIFMHSNDPKVLQVVANFCERVNSLAGVNDEVRASLYPTAGENRGLARSWNDGIENAYKRGGDVAILLNDDMLPGPGDVQRVARTALDNPHCGIVKCMGLDQRIGERTSMEFGLTAITRLGWRKVGYFDENIWPIYWEDIDWDRRRILAGLPVDMVNDTNAIHAGSKTSVTVPGLLEQTSAWYAANEAYYRRKWGGTHHEGERYTLPFNDPRFSLKIHEHLRHRPYGRYDREDVPHA